MLITFNVSKEENQHCEKHIKMIVIFKCLTLYAASLMNCLAAGFQIAGTVNTHCTSPEPKLSSPVLSRITSTAFVWI